MRCVVSTSIVYRTAWGMGRKARSASSATALKQETDTSPRCINALTKLAEQRECKVHQLLQCAEQYAKLPRFEQWGYQDQFARSVPTCMEKVNNIEVIRLEDIMRLVSCVQYFAMSPTSSLLNHYVSYLADAYDKLPDKELTAHALVSFLVGLSGGSNESKEFVRFMKTLTPAINGWNSCLRGRDPVYWLLGLRGLDAQSKSERAFVRALTVHLKKSNWRITDRIIGALSGLQRMSDDIPEVKDLFDFVATKIMNEFDDPINSESMCNALTGLLHKDCSTGVANKVLCRFIQDISGICSDSNTVLSEVRLLQRSASMVFPKLNLGEGTFQDIVAESMGKLNEAVERRKISASDHVSTPQSGIEAEAISRIKSRIKVDGRFVLSNNTFFHGFECDILLRLPDITNQIHSESGVPRLGSVTVNIEIDGPQHTSANKRFLDGLRDDFFQDQGVFVVRVPSNKINAASMTISNIMHLTVERHQSLQSTLKQFIPKEDEFGDSFKKGKMCRSKKVRQVFVVLRKSLFPRSHNNQKTSYNQVYKRPRRFNVGHYAVFEGDRPQLLKLKLIGSDDESHF